MSKDIRKELGIKPFDAADYLTSEEDIKNYLEAMQEEAEAYPDHAAELMLSALRDIARAKSKIELSEKSGLSRQGIYRALAPNARPSLATVMKLARAVGVKMHFELQS